MASLLLGNKEGSIAFRAAPNVMVSRFGVLGAISVCTILNEPRVEDSLGEEGM